MKQNSNRLLPIGFAIFLVAVCLLIFVSENINGRFWLNDFKVYYLASKSLLQGTQVYGIPFGLDSGFYKYSPFVLLLFAPLTFLPYNLAATIYFFLIVFCVLWIFVLLKHFIERYFLPQPAPHQAWTLSATLIFVLSLLHRELHLGNTNILLLLLLLLTIRHLLRFQYILAGTLFGLVILFKPFFLILALPILLHKKWNILRGGIAFALAQYLLFMALFGWSATLKLHTLWAKAILDHSSSFPTQNNISYFLNRFLHIAPPSWFQYALLLSVALAYVLLFLRNKSIAATLPASLQPHDRNFIFESFILMALLPNILNTDTEHFLYTLPLIALLIYTSFQLKRLSLFISLAILFLFYGINSKDIVGATIAHFFDDIGALGLSNLGLIGMAIVVFWKKKDKSQVSDTKY